MNPQPARDDSRHTYAAVNLPPTIWRALQRRGHYHAFYALSHGRTPVRGAIQFDGDLAALNRELTACGWQHWLFQRDGTFDDAS